MVVRCADLRSGSGILRYLWWYAVPIWFLYSGFFDVSLMFASVPCSGFFPVGWKRQPEEGGIGPGCCGGGVITTWAAGDGVIAAGSAV